MDKSKKNQIFKYGFLSIIIYLLFVNLRHILKSDYFYDKFGGVVIVLMLLVNHLAIYFINKGIAGKVMKIIQWGWIIFGVVYTFFIAN